MGPAVERSFNSNTNTKFLDLLLISTLFCSVDLGEIPSRIVFYSLKIELREGNIFSHACFSVILYVHTWRVGAPHLTTHGPVHFGTLSLSGPSPPPDGDGQMAFNWRIMNL